MTRTRALAYYELCAQLVSDNGDAINTAALLARAGQCYCRSGLHDQGTIPGSVFIPRGHLESQAETKLLDRDQPIVLYCAGGNRSAFAAETLQQLGFTDVVSMAGGFGRWKNEGRPWITPKALTPEQRDRYGRHILLPDPQRPTPNHRRIVEPGQEGIAAEADDAAAVAVDDADQGGIDAVDGAGQLFGAALGQYMWTTVADAAASLGGGPVGTNALAPIAEELLHA